MSTAVRIEGELVQLSPTAVQQLEWALADHTAGRPLAAIHPAARARLVGLGLLVEQDGAWVLTDLGVEVATELAAAS